MDYIIVKDIGRVELKECSGFWTCQIVNKGYVATSRGKLRDLVAADHIVCPNPPPEEPELSPLDQTLNSFGNSKSISDKQKALGSLLNFTNDRRVLAILDSLKRTPTSHQAEETRKRFQKMDFVFVTHEELLTIKDLGLRSLLCDELATRIKL